MGRNSSGNRNSSGDKLTFGIGNQQSAADVMQNLNGNYGIGGAKGDVLEDLNLATVNTDMYADIVASYLQVKTQLGDPEADMFMVHTDDDYYGATGVDPKTGRSIVLLNSKYFGPDAKLSDLQKTKNFEKADGYKQTSFFAATVSHELGHAYMNKVKAKFGQSAYDDLSRVLEQQRSSWVKRGKGESLKSSNSRKKSYANTNSHEYNSEMFTRNFDYTDRLNSISSYSMKDIEIMRDFLKNGKQTKKY